MKEKLSRFSISTFIKCMLIIGLTFFANTSFSKQSTTTSAHKLPAYNQKNPFGSGNDKTSVPLCLETLEDTDNDDDSVELRFCTKSNASNISTQVATGFNNNKPVKFTSDNRLPLYILFHAWRGFDC